MKCTSCTHHKTAHELGQGDERCLEDGCACVSYTAQPLWPAQRCYIYQCPDPAARVVRHDGYTHPACERHYRFERQRDDLMVELSGYVSGGMLTAMQDMSPTKLRSFLDQLRTRASAK